MSEGIEIEVDESLKVSGDATKLYTALAEASAEFEMVRKGADGQIGRDRFFKYASYTDVMKSVRPYLAKKGIIVLQPLHSDESGYATTTTIVAGHGASLKSSFRFKADPNPQEFGRHHTYYRRYQLQAMLGLAGDEDADDPPVKETKAQFSEPVKEAKEPAKTAPKAPNGSSLKDKTDKTSSPSTGSSAAPATVETKSAPAKEKEPAPSATSSESSTAQEKPKAKSAPSPDDMKTINTILTDMLKELDWTIADAREFYKEHVDAAGFEKADKMTIEQKRALHAKLVEVKQLNGF